MRRIRLTLCTGLVVAADFLAVAATDANPETATPPNGAVREVTRSFVFLNLRNRQVPAALVVFDRVVSARPDFRKYWLLPTLEEPRVETASATVDCTQHEWSSSHLLRPDWRSCSACPRTGAHTGNAGVLPSRP